MLIENRRRRDAILAEYDPVKGDPDDPLRVKSQAPDGRFCYLPESMTREPGFRSLDEKSFHRLRCLHDFPYWAATCVYIKSKKGGPDIPFVLNRAQRKLVAALEKMRLEGKPIRLILLKARQWGGSTCTQIFMSWIQMVHREGLNSLIVAQQHSATSEIRDMFMRMIENYPQDMLREADSSGKSENDEAGRGKGGKRKRETSKRTEHVGPGSFRVISRNFKVKVGSAEKPDSCRGGDYSLVHCSEVALWRRTKLRTPEDMLRAATSGVLLEPLTMILLESTANGTGNFFHTEYEAAKRGESQFRNLFVAWYEIDQYSKEFEEGEEERFALSLLQERVCEQPVSSRRQPGAYLWWLWEKGATLQAINWYVKERAKYSDHGQMASEYPSDDIEAFVHSGARVFDRYKVEELRKDCGRLPERGEIAGKKETDPESLEDVRFVKSANGALAVWKDYKKEIEPGITLTHRYLVVVDIGGRSMAADWSVIAVIDRGPMAFAGRPEIVAQWRGHTDFDLLAWKAAAIAKYYGDALLVIESNTLETRDRERMVEGDQSYFLLNQIRKAYQNLYARRQSPDEIRMGAPVKYGFHTNVATKPLIISHLVRCVRDNLYVERDEQCIDELLTYEQRPNGSYGALSGHHDDLLMTRAIGLYICFNEMPLPERKMTAPVSYADWQRSSPSAAFF